MERAGIIVKVTEPTDWESSSSWPTCCQRRQPEVTRVASTPTMSKYMLTNPQESGPAPAEVLQGRRLRTSLPDAHVGPGHQIHKHRQTVHSRRPLPPLNRGDTVRVRKGARTTKAQVLRPSGHPLSYNVITADGKLLRRNRQHLLTTKETFRFDDEDDSEDDAHRDATPTPRDPPASPNQAQTVTGALMASAPRITPPTAAPRRSLRQRRTPQPLVYDRDFVQAP
ncbi:unnamed protein product [Ixodes hexagonus]